MKSRPQRLRMALTIAGSDPSGGAGLEADLKTFQAHGVFGLALPTLWTIQNTRGVQRVRWADPDFFREQAKALFADLRPDAIKIGALGSRAMLRRVAALLRSPAARDIPVVLDPILRSTSGAALLEAGAQPELARSVFPRCRILTPNLPEFAALCGQPVTIAEAPELLRAFAAGKPYAILLKGGHGDDAGSDDFLFDHGRLWRLRGPRFGLTPHGTGCALSSALAARLARGESLLAACRGAKAFVGQAILHARNLGRGRPVLDFGFSESGPGKTRRRSG